MGLQGGRSDWLRLSIQISIWEKRAVRLKLIHRSYKPRANYFSDCDRISADQPIYTPCPKKRPHPLIACTSYW